MRFLRRSLIGVFLLAMTAALLAWAGETVRSAVEAKLNEQPRTYPQRERVQSVNVVTVTAQSITPELTVFGDIRSRRTLDIRPTVGGTVIETDPAFVEGGQVQAGQLLFRIDPVDAQAALEKAQADLADAQAELRDSQRALALGQDELAAAVEQADLRAQALNRAKDLQSRGVGSASAVETAELAASSADAAVLSRRQTQAQAQARVDQATTTLSRMQIALAEAQRTLDSTTVTAAFDGTLSGVSVVEGGRVTANEQVGQLIDPKALEVAFRLSTAQYARLLDGQGNLIDAPIAASLDVSDFSIEAAGRITRESAAVGDGQTGRLLFASLESAPGLRPGDFVTVTVAEPELTDVALLPATAVAADQTVLVIGEDERLSAVPVDLLRRQGDNVIIAAADLNGKPVVEERSPLLGAGIKVKPLTPADSAVADAASAAPAAPEMIAPEMIALDPERRAKLVEFVQGSRMPPEAKTRILTQLEQDEVPAETVARIESRMGS